MEVKKIKLKAKNILVTGGAGFIGSHLVEELVKSRVNIIVVDIELHPHSIFALNRLDEKVELQFIDIRERERILKLFKKYNPDYIFHLAAEPIVTQSYENPYKTFETNIMGTVSILEASRQIPTVKGIIVASSDKAYGKSDEPYTEEFPLRGDHPYDVSKSSADLISQAYFKTYNLPIVITRFGNVYGEGDFHMDRIIPGICEAVIKNKTLKIRSDGTYVRDYIYVKDVVNGCITLLENIDKIHGEAFNFSSTDTLSVLELVKKVEKVLRTEIPYKILNIAKNEIPYQHLDASKVRKLGWKPQYSISSTIQKINKWYQKYFKKFYSGINV